jgi:3-hydroxymyristoyl/3-hydroxydecanoyl-(acyl carrier protein) dehydratase
MSWLPEIVAERREPDAVELDLHVSPALPFFRDHFPGLPILPGVVQIDWAVNLGRGRLGLRGEFRAAENLKFLSLVRPGARPTLRLALAGGRLSFSYQTGARRYSTGVLVFA